MTTTFVITGGDVSINEATGQPRLVADGDKLTQDVAEMLSTEALLDHIGAGLDDVVGTVGDVFTIRNELARRVRRALNTLVSLQQLKHRAQRPQTERVSGLSAVSVVPLEGALTAFGFRVEVRTEDGGRSASTGVVS